MSKFHTVVACLLMTCASGFSQSATWNNVKALAPGTEIRVERTGLPVLRGDMESASDDSLVLNTGKGQEMLNRQQVARVSVAKPGHRARNALIGIGIGVGGGLAIGFGSSQGPDLIPSSVTRAGSAAGGAVIGALIGAVIPTSGWREIYHQ